jgi:hypothetical protein
MVPCPHQPAAVAALGRPSCTPCHPCCQGLQPHPQLSPPHLTATYRPLVWRAGWAVHPRASHCRCSTLACRWWLLSMGKVTSTKTLQCCVLSSAMTVELHWAVLVLQQEYRTCPCSLHVLLQVRAPPACPHWGCSPRSAPTCRAGRQPGVGRCRHTSRGPGSCSGVWEGPWGAPAAQGG